MKKDFARFYNRAPLRHILSLSEKGYEFEINNGAISGVKTNQEPIFNTSQGGTFVNNPVGIMRDFKLG